MILQSYEILTIYLRYGAFEHEEKQKKERKTRSPDEDLARIQKLKGTEPNVVKYFFNHS